MNPDSNTTVRQGTERDGAIPTSSPQSEESVPEAQRVTPPFKEQTFTSFQEWVNKASSWLTRHPHYNDTQHGDRKGWRGHHFTAMCFDSFGRRCRNGGDFQRAHDEGAFPVWWIWPDQIVDLVRSLSPIPQPERE